ncbi:unnamed protein product [Caenorhabditis brenneri]
MMILGNRRMMKAIILGFLCLGQAMAQQPTQDPPPPTPDKWSLQGPVESIQGTYKMETVRIDDHPPTLASVWELGGGDFSIVAWPPKHCAAVHVLFIDSKYKGRGNFHVVPDMVKSPTVKFYPPIGKVEISLDGSTYETLYNLRTSIHFKKLPSSEYAVELSTQHLDKQKEFEGEANQMQTLKMKLDSRMALVLTNSRYCFAHIIKTQRNADYSQLFDRATHDGDLPKDILYRYEDPRAMKSFFIPQVTAPSTKSVDLLPILLNPEFYPPAQMRQKPSCNGFRSASRNPLKRAIGVISVDSWLGGMKNMRGMESREEQFYIDVGKECSWIRIWISKQGNKMQNYDTAFKPEEAIDIFFDQQFVVGPDSDEARPLSGNSTQINRISIRRHWDGSSPQQNPTEKRIVQMSYGRAAGPALTYIEYFHMPSFLQADFQVNLIKAPKCEANLVTSGDTIRTQSANRPRVNSLLFKTCERSLLKNTNDDALKPSDVEDLKKADQSVQ